MAPRAAVFPAVFAVSLVFLGVAYYNRKSLFSEVFEGKREKYLESRQQASKFKALVAEGVKKEKEQCK